MLPYALLMDYLLVYSFYLANNKVQGFYSGVKYIIATLVKQGYLLNKMKCPIGKYFNKHFCDFTFKYWRKLIFQDIINLISQQQQKLFI